MNVVISPYLRGNKVQDSRWVPETTDRTKPYIYYAFFPTHTHDKVFTLGTARN